MTGPAGEIAYGWFRFVAKSTRYGASRWRTASAIRQAILNPAMPTMRITFHFEGTSTGALPSVTTFPSVRRWKLVQMGMMEDAVGDGADRRRAGGPRRSPQPRDRIAAAPQPIRRCA
ncbi:MAG: hypothetical protein IPK33_11455 [Gemmatimonadetes bacterium]|nr:hypothetical protein [Gemmatimonadota bacterium]